MNAQFQEITGTFIPEDADKPRALAELFCKLFGDQQAAFFDHVAEISEGWERPACFQWSNMDDITPRARELLHVMFTHTEKSAA